jgi:putative heme-binding domain-containing protein
MWVIRACIFALAASPLLVAQQIYTGGESEDGKRLFVANCAPCHGPDGDAIAGVDFGYGKFRRASSDHDVLEIVKAGIPGTGMPGFSNELSEVEIRRLAAYLHYLAGAAQNRSAPGDAAHGKTIFEGTGGCLECHRVKDKGSRVGPDLTEIGSVRRLVELERSILEPDAEILPQNRFVRVVTRDDVTITGRLLNQDTFTVQLIDSKERLRSFERSNLKEYVFRDKSPMPSYQGKLNPRELADLVSYLVSLKGAGTR